MSLERTEYVLVMLHFFGELVKKSAWYGMIIIYLTIWTTVPSHSPSGTGDLSVPDTFLNTLYEHEYYE